MSSVCSMEGATTVFHFAVLYNGNWNKTEPDYIF